MLETDQFSTEMARAEAWFTELRDRIRVEFEQIEILHRHGPLEERKPAEFSVTEQKGVPKEAKTGAAALCPYCAAEEFSKRPA